MLVANLATLMLAKVQLLGLWLFQEDTSVNWSDPVSLLKHMGWPAITIVIVLFIMSAWSIGVMIDRWIAFNAARKQSRAFAPAVAGALREGKLDEAIVHAELKRGISTLATIASSAPFVGLLGTVVGIINAFQGIASEKSTGLA